MAPENKLSIVKETIVENSFKAVLYSNGIVEFSWDKALQVVEVKHIVKRKEVLFDFGGGKKMPVYLNVPDFIRYSKEAQMFASTEEGGKYTLATAVLINNIANKMQLDFYWLAYKPKTPAKGFTNREDAFEWLEKLQKEYEMNV